MSNWIDGPQPLYDYDNQAWTEMRNGRRVYVRCGHPEEMECDCYGRLHMGEAAAPIGKIVVDPNLKPRKKDKEKKGQ